MGEFISQQESREPSRFSILAQLTLEDSLAAMVLAKGETVMWMLTIFMTQCGNFNKGFGGGEGGAYCHKEGRKRLPQTAQCINC